MPSDPSIKLHADKEALLPNPSSFQHLIGRLLYMTNTKPDISFAVQQLSQFVSSLVNHTCNRFYESFDTWKMLI